MDPVVRCSPDTVQGGVQGRIGRESCSESRGLKVRTMGAVRRVSSVHLINIFNGSQTAVLREEGGAGAHVAKHGALTDFKMQRNAVLFLDAFFWYLIYQIQKITHHR